METLLSEIIINIDHVSFYWKSVTLKWAPVLTPRLQLSPYAAEVAEGWLQVMILVFMVGLQVF